MRPNYDDIRRLVVKMREGSKEARRELIEAHVGLAFKASQEFEDDEALSDALETLVLEVDNFRREDKHPAALPAYLKVALNRAAMRHKRPSHHTPSHDASRFIYSGKSLGSPDHLAVVDAMDEVIAVCESDEEREMVYWRSMSLTNAEVGAKIWKSPTYVADAMRRLQLRFQVQERHRA